MFQVVRAVIVVISAIISSPAETIKEYRERKKKNQKLNTDRGPPQRTMSPVIVAQQTRKSLFSRFVSRREQTVATQDSETKVNENKPVRPTQTFEIDSRSVLVVIFIAGMGAIFIGLLTDHQFSDYGNDTVTDSERYITVAISILSFGLILLSLLCFSLISVINGLGQRLSVMTNLAMHHVHDPDNNNLPRLVKVRYEDAEEEATSDDTIVVKRRKTSTTTTVAAAKPV